MKTPVYLDIETYSECDLRTEGTYRYASHGSTSLLLLAWATGTKGPLQRWSPAEGQPMPAELRQILEDPDQILVAHNAQFERVLMQRLLWPMPLGNPSRWRCSMALAHSLALPGSLEELCHVLKVPADKAKLADGKRLIRLFCVPDRLGDPVRPDRDAEKWQRFCEYCANDVVALQEVIRRLARWKLSPEEQALWELDQIINDQGWPVDRSLVDAALAVRELDEKRGVARSKEITDLDNPNSRDQLLAFLRDSGIEIQDLTKNSVKEALKREDLPGEIRELLELRQGLAKSSIKKFSSLRTATGQDGRIRGTLQFSGASRTGRWSGRIFQPQNLARPTLKDDEIETAIQVVKTGDEDLVRALYSDTPGVLSSLIRPAICAPKGRTLVSCDYASIESIMLAWAAQSEYLLDLYAQGRDPYKDFAAKRFSIPYESVTKAQRTWAKPAVLGCGYMLGGPGLVAYATGYGVSLTEAEGKAAVDTYRREYSDIPKFWWQLDEWVRCCIKTGEKTRVGHFTFEMDGPFLRVLLPSGRALSYLNPKLEMRPTPWGEDRLQITYMGRDLGTKLIRISTHPGKITENIVQAIARDVLAYGLTQAHKAGLQILGHVHDEIIVECDADQGEAVLQQLTQIMSETPPWCPDAPISAAGWTGTYYRKD